MNNEKSENKSDQKPKSFQKFERLTFRRSELHFHEQNPRTIDKYAFKKLRNYVKKHGLLNALVVNRRTVAKGFPPEEEGRLVIVGGHQRCRAMDDVCGDNVEYDVPCDVLEVTPQQERATLVALNNAAMQGTWDTDILGEIFLSGVSIEDTGFDRAELGVMFDQGVLDDIYGNTSAEQIAIESPVVAELNAMADLRRGMKGHVDQNIRDEVLPQPPLSQPEGIGVDAAENEAIEDAGQEQPVSAPTDVEVEPPQLDRNSREAMIARRKDYIERSADANDASFTITLVADTSAEAREFLSHLRLPVNQQFYALSAFQDAVRQHFK